MLRLQDLPIDVLHRIINYTVPGPSRPERRYSALLSSALLSKSFARASQIALLEHIFLDGHLNMIELLEVMTTTSARAICHSSCISLRLYCQTLNDKESIWNSEEILKRLPGVKAVWFGQVTANLTSLSIAANLTKLDLSKVKLMIDGPTQYGLFKAHLPSLTQLSLNRVSLYTSLRRDKAEPLSFFLNPQSLPTLSHLSLTYDEADDSSRPTFPGLCSQLSHLRIRRVVGFSPLPRLEFAQLSSSRHMTHLSLDLRETEDLDLLLSRPLPESLHSLQITKLKTIEMERRLLSSIASSSGNFRYLILDRLGGKVSEGNGTEEKRKGNQLVRRVNVGEASKWGIKVLEVDSDRECTDGETWFEYTAAIDCLGKSQEEQKVAGSEE